MDNIKTDDETGYFDKSMQQEFHIEVARREATKILRHLNYQKAASSLEKHFNYHRENRRIIGS